MSMMTYQFVLKCDISINLFLIRFIILIKYLFMSWSIIGGTVAFIGTAGGGLYYLAKKQYEDLKNIIER